MLKKLALIMLCALPLGIFAQELKLGHINSKEIISIMPEIPGIEKKVDEIGKQYETEITKMSEEYNGKIKEYQQKQDSMPDGIKQIRMSEIQEIEQRITNFRQTAYTELQKKQQELFNPVVERVRKAINDVATENKYTYIFDLSTQSIIYQAPTSKDITALVKAKLGIK